MRDARVPEDAEEVRRRVRFDSIERLARKLLDKEAGCARGCMRAVENSGLVRRGGANYSPCIRMNVQLKGPPNGTWNESCLAVWKSPWGSEEALNTAGGAKFK